jgi:hypothetical protein
MIVIGFGQSGLAAWQWLKGLPRPPGVARPIAHVGRGQDPVERPARWIASRFDRGAVDRLLARLGNMARVLRMAVSVLISRPSGVGWTGGAVSGPGMFMRAMPTGTCSQHAQNSGEPPEPMMWVGAGVLRGGRANHLTRLASIMRMVHD